MRGKISLSFSIGLCLLFTACVSEIKQEQRDRIIIAEKNDAATLNPVSASDEMSLYLSQQIFQPLLALDFESEKLVGVLSDGRPQIELKNGQQWIHYQLRTGASFGDGSPVTVKDVLFSLKANICPLVKNVGGINYYGRIIDSVKWSPQDSLQFTFVCNRLNSRNEMISGDFSVLQESVYDSLNLLRNFSYESLKSREDLEENDTIQRFAEQFNATDFAFNSKYISGSGAYELVEWTKGQRMVLKQKQNWWGKKYADQHKLFVVNAPLLQYEVIPDENTALTALKTGEIDFSRHLPAKSYLELLEEDTPSVAMAVEDVLGYQYLMFNLNHPILSSLQLRKALAHAVPLEQIITTVFLDQASITHVPFSPKLKSLVNDTLKGYPYQLEKTKELLAAEGWEDTDEDGILDKQIGAEAVPLEFTYLYNSENNNRKAVGLVLQNEFKKIGVKLNIQALEWSVYLQKVRGGDFEISYGGSVSPPVSPNFSGAFHSKSANGGRNYANYQNPMVDSLIDAMALELDAEESNKQIKLFQEIVHNDLPYLFLLTPKKHIAFSKELKNANIYSMRPNFWAPELSW